MDRPGHRRRRGHRGRRRDRAARAGRARPRSARPTRRVPRRDGPTSEPPSAASSAIAASVRHAGPPPGLARGRPARRRDRERSSRLASGCRRPGLRPIRGRTAAGAGDGRGESGPRPAGASAPSPSARSLQHLGSHLLPRPLQAHRHPVPHRQGRRGCGGIVRLLLGRCRFIGRIFRRIRVAGAQSLSRRTRAGAGQEVGQQRHARPRPPRRPRTRPAGPRR